MKALVVLCALILVTGKVAADEESAMKAYQDYVQNYTSASPVKGDPSHVATYDNTIAPTFTERAQDIGESAFSLVISVFAVIIIFAIFILSLVSRNGKKVIVLFGVFVLAKKLFGKK